MKCFFHTDCDGKASAAIVHKYYNENYDGKQEYIPINYNMEFPFDSIKKDENIVIVDFSLQKKEDFSKLLGITSNVTWIDHHKTAIERHGGLELMGLRRDGISGCELAWEYYYPNKETPWVIRFLGDYDTWTFKYGDETKELQSGIKLHDTSPESDNWYTWFTNSLTLDLIIKEGRTILKYQSNVNKSTVKCSAFFTMFEGYKAVCCNGGGISGSTLFDSVKEDVDIKVNFWYDGSQWSVSIYTIKDIDCSVIAKKYGGGGHAKACGFQCKELPFGKDNYRIL